ncbi:MAG: M23 family metallopeptidase [Synechococcus sp.]
MPLHLKRCENGLPPIDGDADALAVGYSSCISDVFLQHFLSLLNRGVEAHLPAQGEFTSGFGYRWGRHHRGIDIANAIGTPIRAAWAGQVVGAKWLGGYGLTVEIRHQDGSLTRYAHCSRLLVAEGDRVAAGETIAEMGNTGISTGPHLHFEVIDAAGVAVDPVDKIQALEILAS